MKKLKLILPLVLVSTMIFSSSTISYAAKKNSAETPKLVDEASIDSVISAMTLEEKAHFVVGTGMDVSRVPGAAGATYAIPRLGIPSIIVVDGPAGVRIIPTRPGDPNKYYATAFPISTLIASTWNTTSAKTVGNAMGQEVKEYGIDILLTPALNIQRNPLGGRNFEYYSEDPLVSGEMTTAVVDGVQSNGVGAAIKHFAANNQETNRIFIDTIVSQRALREIYLKGFEFAVKKAQPWSVMSSYNKINGTYTSESKGLLTDILRGEWGFKGFVMTDWWIFEKAPVPVTQMKAQNDLIMPGGTLTSNVIEQPNIIITAVKNGTLDEKVLDRNIRNILRIIVKTPTFNGYKYSNKPDLAKNAQISRQVATEGMVLLKNDGFTLPLNKGASIGLFGNTQIETIKGGTGSGDVNSGHIISIADGLQATGFKLHQGLLNNYSAYISQLREKEQYKPYVSLLGKVIPPIPERPITISEINTAVSGTDVGIIVIGRISGEFADRKNEKGDFLLTDLEQNIISEISNRYHAAGKKVAVILNIGGPIEVASWRDKVDGILLAWQPGQEAGYAIADILSGAVNPSGKLATTFPMTYSNVSSAANFPGTPPQNPTKVVYAEDIYVGYRYNTTFNIKPAYEFGYGLSYTTFEYSDVILKKDNVDKNKITILTTVKNTGKVAGKEAVQGYISAPKGKLKKLKLELKAFRKTKDLQPDEKEILKFELDIKDMASFDETLSAWVVEKGTYEVKIGASSENIKGTASFTIDEDIIVEKVKNVLTPQISISNLSK
ncbi:glycosyl hydrolase [Clostridium polyendosporum]|uniref:Glycosyl hydrolase n=1 Tax=Clostridium polyendosporum TaxID=69208 RepID=A0A919VML9_9CLOT|nr:glycoside hydrolase family 3 protein [Clostridium polyendosporum]GIM29718.1 glycosyl hydrolase [Clostridium polyendosporum]